MARTRSQPRQIKTGSTPHDVTARELDLFDRIDPRATASAEAPRPARVPRPGLLRALFELDQRLRAPTPPIAKVAGSDEPHEELAWRIEAMRHQLPRDPQAPIPALQARPVVPVDPTTCQSCGEHAALIVFGRCDLCGAAARRVLAATDTHDVKATTMKEIPANAAATLAV